MNEWTVVTEDFTDFPEDHFMVLGAWICGEEKYVLPTYYSEEDGWVYDDPYILAYYDEEELNIDLDDLKLYAFVSWPTAP